MKRSISSVVFVLAAAVTAPATVAYADDPPPSAKDIEAAKKAFAAGKKLHEQGKLPEAIEKFKESYRLSKNPLLLYNIGLTMEEAGMEDLALFYFRKFLAEAPADAQQRDVVTERVKGLEKKFGVGGSTTTTTTTTKPDPVKPDPTATKPVDIKPAGTYSASDFQHQIVDAAPPGKPLDVTAFVPEDSGFTVTLHYRAAGEATFKAKPMKWRYKELVGRIPAGKMAGSAVQYYIEVKDQAGTVVTRSGKSTSPNQVLLEADATPRFYPDVSDDGEAQISDAQIKARDDEDDPLASKRPKPKKNDIVVQPIEQGPPGTGFSDVGSSKFTYAKWGTTATAATLLGFGVFSVIQAGKYASSLEEDASKCGAPPCNQFDSYAQDLESSGKRWQTFGNVGIGVGLGVGVVAGYFWYKELRAKKRGDMKVGAAAPGETTSTSWILAPQVGHGYTGAAAAVRF